ncbi:MAG: TraM recognition domain-containing protein [Planctomycetes bacterium]|nr:TraM recognition domain-containing protein [Planctomycetota bacterium]
MIIDPTNPFHAGAVGLGVGAVACLCKKLFAAKRPKARPPAPMLWINDRDAISISELTEGVLITGSTGSGKTSGPLQAINDLLLREDAGILQCTAKSDDIDFYRRAAERCSRKLVRFGLGSPYRFDFLNYALSGPGGSVADAVSLMRELVGMQTRGEGGGDNKFWDDASARHLELSVSALWRAWGRAGVPDLYRFVTSCPQQESALKSPKWLSGFCAQTLVRLNEVMRRDDVERDILEDYFTSEWPELSDKTKSVIHTITLGILSKFMTGPLAHLVWPAKEGEISLTPEAVLNGEAVCIDCPTLVYGEPARMIQAVWKMSMQRSALRRGRGKPVAIISDEAHLTALPGNDSKIQAVCRSAGLIQVNVIQNIPLLVSALGGGAKAQQEAEAWIANLQTKIICANGCKTTNAFFSQLLGESKQLLLSTSNPQGNTYDLVGDLLGLEEPQGSVSASQHWRVEVEASEFTRQRKGGPQNDMVVTAIVSMGGRRFANGKAWTRGFFHQRR